MMNQFWLPLVLLGLAADGSKCFEQQRRRSFATNFRGGATRPLISLSVSANKPEFAGKELLNNPSEVCLLVISAVESSIPKSTTEDRFPIVLNLKP
jgi:hypothetical protein